MSYRARSRGRSPSPRRPPPPRRSRDFSPSRHWRHSPRHHHRREAELSRRIEKRDHRLDRDFDVPSPRLVESDNRDKDRRYADGGRRYHRSPRRVSSPRRIERRRDGFDDKERGNVVRSMRSNDENSYRGDSSLAKFQWDHHRLDGSRKPDHFKDYGHTRDYNGVGDTTNAATTTPGDRDYYRDSRYSDSGRAGLLSASQYPDCAKPVYSRSYTLLHGGVDDDVPVSKLSVGDGSGQLPSVASRYLNSDTDKLGYAHFRDELRSEKRDGSLHEREERYLEKKNDGLHYKGGFLGVEKGVGEESYKFKNEDSLLSSRGYLKGDSEYMGSSSQPRDYVPVSSDVMREAFSGYSDTRDIYKSSHLTQPIGFGGYKEMTQSMLATGPGGRLDETRSSSRLYSGLTEEKDGDYVFADFGRSKIGNMSTRLNDVEEDYRDQNRQKRIEDLNPTVDEFSRKKPMRDDGSWDQYPFPRVHSTPDKLDSSRSVHARKQELDNMLGSGSSRLNYGSDGYFGYESVKNENRNTGVGDGQWSHVEKPDILQSRGYEPSFARLYDSPRKGSTWDDLGSVEPSERRMRNNHSRDEILYEQDAGIRISADGNGTRKIYNQYNVGDEFDHLNFSKKAKWSRSNYEDTSRAQWSDVAHDLPTPSKFHPSHSVNSDRRDIKKRLGPASRRLHVSQRLVKPYKPPIRKRLAPPPPKKRGPAPWMKNRSSKITANVHESLGRESLGSPHDREGGHLEDHLPVAKPEPPETSDDFKQLVQSAFFKFLKQINDTPAKIKKYMEQGKAGSLKCIVCGSNSDEFVETESLANHAFSSDKVGLRSQHLGLHKALCVLMGWKCTEQSSREWRCEVLSYGEISALKEDLIIWPPVVIVHNSTIENKNPDERVIVSAEKLDMKLRDMGFGSVVKVCNGKPANQSVMLVKFNGTLSGLQEAERYHKSYVESKHGRDELLQFKTENELSTQVISAEGEDFLYGHLGIAEDLDKLNFDTKKRCVLRSKKEILSIVNAP